jgi:hypothetical protein
MTSTATQPIPAPQDGAPHAARDRRITASEWFTSGARRRYDPVAIQWFPGGHLTTFEHPELLADAIRGLPRAHRVGQPIRPNPDTTGARTP